MQDYDEPGAWVRTVALREAVSRWRRGRRSVLALVRLGGATDVLPPTGDVVDKVRVRSPATISAPTQHGAQIPAAAMLTTGMLGVHWYPGSNPDGGERPVAVTGIERQLPSADLQPVPGPPVWFAAARRPAGSYARRCCAMTIAARST